MKKLLTYSALCLIAAIGFTSCLKTSKFYEGFDGIKPIADIPLSQLSNSSDSATYYWIDLLKDPNAMIDTALAVHLSSKNHVGDITFKLALAKDDPAFLQFMKTNSDFYALYNDDAYYGSLTDAEQSAMDDYANAHPFLTVMPDSLYSIPSFDVTIKNAGVLNVGSLPMKFRTGAVDGSGLPVFTSHSYVLPIKLVDAAGYEIASNFREAFIFVGAKNKYDGKYRYQSSAATSLVPNQDKTVTLYTLGLNSVKFNLLAYYSNEVDYTIDPNTNQITVTCPSLGVQTPQDTRSKYDPATGNMKIYWKQGNGARTFEETFTYIGPR